MTGVSIGIDLGTSNSVVSICSIDGKEVSVLPVPQIFGPGEAGQLESLPSHLYTVPSHERDALSSLLAWQFNGTTAGVYARARSLETPERVVSSAKSWLSQKHVKRDEKILPWGSKLEEKFSPIDASAHYLTHLRHSLEHHFKKVGASTTLTDSEVVLTVPASFDEEARALTEEAARRAGFPLLTLLEEPQAAFYDWLSVEGDNWRKRVSPGDTILVCDVGGGTTDFSLMLVEEVEGNLQLSRVSVGDHILLGGDNMDLTLAFRLRAMLEESGKSLDEWQMLTLIALCREAKEKLLGQNAPKELPLSIPSKGANLFKSSLKVTLTQALVEEVILEGFFPEVSFDTAPVERKTVGLREAGLRYASDTAITRHLAAFLRRSIKSGSENALSFPRKVLFNGGVFNSSTLRARAQKVLTSWKEGEVEELISQSKDLAVARGASLYGALKRSGEGIRIRSRAPRSYFLGVESTTLSVPGFIPPLRGLCIVKQGCEEGVQYELPELEFSLAVGEAIEFRVFSSLTHSQEVGEYVNNAEKELNEVTTLTTSVQSEHPSDEWIPVTLEVHLSELGIMTVWIKEKEGERRWRLEVQIREEASATH